MSGTYTLISAVPPLMLLVCGLSVVRHLLLLVGLLAALRTTRGATRAMIFAAYVRVSAPRRCQVQPPDSCYPDAGIIFSKMRNRRYGAFQRGSSATGRSDYR